MADTSAAAGDLAEDEEVNISTIATDNFVETYYAALNNRKGKPNLTSFYVEPGKIKDVEPRITLNGHDFKDPAQVQRLFEEVILNVLYDVEVYDCQVLNPHYITGAPESGLDPSHDGRKMSILVTVSGSVKYWSDKQNANEAESKAFTETFVLVPNWETFRPNAAKGLKKWLITAQTFRRNDD